MQTYDHKWRIYKPFKNSGYWFVRPPDFLPYGITWHVKWEYAMNHVDYMLRNME